MYNMATAGMLPRGHARAPNSSGVLELAPRTRSRSCTAGGPRTATPRRFRGTSRVRGRSATAGHAVRSGDAPRQCARAGRISRSPTGHHVAVEQFLTRDTLHECWYDDRLTLVHLSLRWEIVRRRRGWSGGGRGTTACSNGFDDVVWTLERARVFERLGLTRRGGARTTRSSPRRGAPRIRSSSPSWRGTRRAGPSQDMREGKRRAAVWAGR